MPQQGFIPQYQRFEDESLSVQASVRKDASASTLWIAIDCEEVRMIRKKLWRLLFLLPVLSVTALVLTLCRERTPEEYLAYYNKKLGREAELTSTHMFIRWRDGPMPVTLRIPREYTQGTPASKDGKGGLDSVYIVFALPDGKPYVPILPASEPVSPERIERIQAHKRTRVFTIVRRDGAGPNAARHRRDYMRNEALDTKWYWPDGTVGGLDRYSKIMCSTAESPGDESLRQLIQEKPADDPSPSNCRMNRSQQLLLSPPAIQDSNEIVTVSCLFINCAAYFQAASRIAEVQISFEDLERWREFVKPAQNVVNSFFIDE